MLSSCRAGQHDLQAVALLTQLFGKVYLSSSLPLHLSRTKGKAMGIYFTA
jgi:hypothetical protein